MRKKLLGLWVVLGVVSAHAMDLEPAGLEQPAPTAPEQDIYSKILSPQNRRYLESLGYSGQNIEQLIVAQRFQEQEGNKPLLKFYEQEKACPADLAAQDSKARFTLRLFRAEGDRIANNTRAQEVKLHKLKKWDKCKLVTIPITLLITSPIAIWLMVSVFGCKPHAS